MLMPPSELAPPSEKSWIRRCDVLSIKIYAHRVKVEADAKSFFDVCRSLIFVTFVFAFARCEQTIVGSSLRFQFRSTQYVSNKKRAQVRLDFAPTRSVIFCKHMFTATFSGGSRISQTGEAPTPEEEEAPTYYFANFLPKTA